MPKIINRSTKFCCDIFALRRKVLGLSLEDIGRSLKLTKNAISHWENGEFEPRPKFIPKLAKLLKMNPRNLVRQINVKS